MTTISGTASLPASEAQQSWVRMIAIALGQMILSFIVASLPVALGGMVKSFGVALGLTVRHCSAAPTN